MGFTKLIRPTYDNINVTNNNNTMQKFKISTDKSIKLNGIKFKPYTVGNLPPSFGFKYDEDKDKDGIYQWFNYKGLTYVEDKKTIWDAFA